jgi:hypothetical protein
MGRMVSSEAAGAVRPGAAARSTQGPRTVPQGAGAQRPRSAAAVPAFVPRLAAIVTAFVAFAPAVVAIYTCGLSLLCQPTREG